MIPDIRVVANIFIHTALTGVLPSEHYDSETTSTELVTVD